MGRVGDARGVDLHREVGVAVECAGVRLVGGPFDGAWVPDTEFAPLSPSGSERFYTSIIPSRSSCVESQMSLRVDGTFDHVYALGVFLDRPQ